MLYSNSNMECIQEPELNQQIKTTLGIILITLGLLSSAANIWLVSSLFLRAEMISYIHLRLLNLSIACFGRGILAGYPFQATSAIAGRWLFGEPCCKLFAFLHQFFSISEVISLMFLTRECLYLIQPSYLGTSNNYIGSTLGGWLMSLLWAILPFFGFGRYSCDVMGISCSLNWAYTNKYEFSFLVCYSMLIIGLPLFYTFWNVFHAVSLSSINFHFSGQEKLNSIKAVLAVSFSLVLFWFPKGMLSAFSFLHVDISEMLIFITAVSTEFSGLCPVLSFICFDKRTRCTLLARNVEQDLLHMKSIVKNRRFEAEF